MRILNSAPAAILFLASTINALAITRPRPHSTLSPSLYPRQENEKFFKAGRPLLRNTDLVIKQSDVEDDGTLKPEAQIEQAPPDESPFFDLEDVDCEVVMQDGGEPEDEENSSLKEQLRQLCEVMEEDEEKAA